MLVGQVFRVLDPRVRESGFLGSAARRASALPHPRVPGRGSGPRRNSDLTRGSRLLDANRQAARAHAIQFCSSGPSGVCETAVARMAVIPL
jgi:hypothetical protein